MVHFLKQFHSKRFDTFFESSCLIASTNSSHSPIRSRLWQNNNQQSSTFNFNLVERNYCWNTLQWIEIQFRYSFFQILIFSQKTKGQKEGVIFSYPLWLFIPLFLFMVSDTPVLRNVFLAGVLHPLKNVAFPVTFPPLQLENISFYAFGKENTFRKQFFEISW